MKRTLVLIRHAKSDWGNAGLRDYDRPLNERGLRDAPELGRRLHEELKLAPAKVLSSTARRAAETTHGVLQGLGLSKMAVQWEDEMYHASPATLEEVLFGVDDAYRTVFMVAHNPGISEFAHQLLPGLPLAEMPTCCAVALETDAARWQDMPLAKNSLLFIDTPKNPSATTNP